MTGSQIQEPTPRYDREVLLTVLIYHQRKDIGGCACGWGVDSGHLGKSHAKHVADVYEESITGRVGDPA